MEVLHVHSGNLFGGVERMLQTLAPATAGRVPVRSSFALCFDGQTSEALRAAEADVFPLGPVRASRPDQVWRARRAVRQVLHKAPWDVVCVHSSWSQAIFGPEIRRAGFPLVRWLHAPQPGPRWLEDWAARSPAALVLCNSRYTYTAAQRRIGSSPFAVQYPPAVLPETREDRIAVRTELGTPSDTIVIVLAARLEAGKGHRLLIDSLARLPPGAWEAWIVGGAQQRSERVYLDELQSQAAAAQLNGRVRFLGQRSDVARVLSAADVYCQPNQAADSFGLSFVEALAAGLPVITTRLGAATEIVDDGCGVLVEVGSPAAIAETLQRLIEHTAERAQMSAAARTRAREFCDLPRSLSQLAAHLSLATTNQPVS